jgi:outer membrane protein insertion porin family
MEKARSVLTPIIVAAFFAFPARISAQQGTAQVLVDSIAVEGNFRVPRDSILTLLGVVPGQVVSLRDVQNGVKSIMAEGNFRDVQIRLPGAAADGATFVVSVEERPQIRTLTFEGLERVDAGDVQDSVGLAGGSPFSEAKLHEAQRLIRTELAEEGIPFATMDHRLEPVEGLTNVVDVVIEVEEGDRVAVADIQVDGNESISRDEILSAMATRREGFWWFQQGSYTEEAFEQDLYQRIPSLYHSRGYLDFRILSDTIVVDPSNGKARVVLDVEEGPQYRLARFNIDGNDVIGDEAIEDFFFQEEGGLLQALGFASGRIAEEEQLGRVFDQMAFEQARQEVQELYNNEGYIFAQVGLTTEKLPPEESDGQHMVSVNLQVIEGSPAFVNRIDIEGNDFTHEWVIRNQIQMLPGDLFSLQRVISSYQSIASLGFFETPLPNPDIRPDENTGEVDVTFYVVEKQTGSVNFGTSVGGGVGLSGFIGYEQPNLFGQGKQGQLRWDFGRYLNNFLVSYQDPALFRSRISGTVSIFDSRDRFFQFRSGERNRRGMSLRFGFPISGWRRTRFFTGYSLSRTRYDLFSGVDDQSVFGLPPGTQSQVSLGLTRTTLNHPLFPSQGSRQSLSLEMNGGVLGGDGTFQKVSAEGTWRVPIGELGGGGMGGSSNTFSLGLAVRTGIVLGDASDFPFDRFWMGGVNFGEVLRGYDETSITPLGYYPERSGTVSDIDRLGNAFLGLTADYSLKVGDQMQVSSFFDAGNVWRSPRNMDPTQLFRGAGVGIQIVTPFGPIGLDYAYGFDKTTPGWQFHFRMGGGL